MSGSANHRMEPMTSSAVCRQFQFVAVNALLVGSSSSLGCIALCPSCLKFTIAPPRTKPGRRACAQRSALRAGGLISASLRPKQAVLYVSRSHSTVRTKPSLRQRRCGNPESTSRESRIMNESRWPNERASLDAAVAFCLYFGDHWRRASEPEC